MDVSNLASSIDMVPTVLSPCGLESTGQMQGINMLDESARKEGLKHGGAHRTNTSPITLIN